MSLQVTHTLGYVLKDEELLEVLLTARVDVCPVEVQEAGSADGHARPVRERRAVSPCPTHARALPWS